MSLQGEYFTLILSSFSGILIFYLGFLTYKNDAKNIVNRLFFWFTVIVFIWIGGVILRFASDVETLMIIGARITFAAAVYIGLFLFLFTYHFPRKNLQYDIDKFKNILIAASSLIALLALFTPWVVRHISVVDGAQIDTYGWAYWIFALFFISLFIGSVFNIFSKRKDLNEIELTQTKYILTGFTISVLLALVSNVFIPIATGITYFAEFSPFAVIFFVGFTSYAIVKHQLFNIRVLVTEVFTTLIILIFLIEVFLSQDTPELIFNIILLIIASIFGILLVRGTIREISTLQELSETKSEFLSIASHQLRTPISVLKGYLSMLREGSYGKLNPKQLEVINKAYRANEGMLMLVNDFLNLSRAEKGTLKYNFEKIDLRDMIGRIVDEFELSAKSKGIALNWEKPRDPIMVDVDMDKFRQVVANLIDNAIKYTREGGISVRLVTETMFGNVARIYVADTGIGIKAGEEDRIFQSFQRGEKGEKENVTGAGLGLYVVKMIVEGHGGKISAESRGVDQGTTFIVEIPLASANNKKHDTEQNLHTGHN